MKIISWNINGIRACIKKGFLGFLKKENPEIICIQEIKAQEKDLSQIKEELSKYNYNPYINAAKKKGYSGTAIFTKVKPIKIIKGIDLKKFDEEGRTITLEFPSFFLINIYTPNSGRGLLRLSFRKEWDKNFLIYLKRLDKKKPLIICGDFNVSHKEIDLARPKQNYNKVAGFTQSEIDGFENILKAGFIDIFRELNKNKKAYTYWSYMFNARTKNIGWRIDYFLLSKRIQKIIKSAFILPKVMGSDHCPIEINLK